SASLELLGSMGTTSALRGEWQKDLGVRRRGAGDYAKILRKEVGDLIACFAKNSGINCTFFKKFPRILCSLTHRDTAAALGAPPLRACGAAGQPCAPQRSRWHPER